MRREERREKRKERKEKIEEREIDTIRERETHKDHLTKSNRKMYLGVHYD